MAAQARPLVLVLERDQAVAASLAFALRLEGFEVEVCSKVPALLAAAETLEAACLLLDADHPDVRPADLLRRLRARGQDAPAIFTATNPRRGLRTETAAASARLLEKPWTGEGVVAEIQRAVSPRQQGAPLEVG